MSPEYVSELYQPTHHGHNTRMPMYKLRLSYRNSNYGQKIISFLGPKLWNNLPAAVKSCTNVNTFKVRVGSMIKGNMVTF